MDAKVSIIFLLAKKNLKTFGCSPKYSYLCTRN